MNSYDYFTPKSLSEVWDLNKEFPGAGYIAGGTDMMVRIKNREIGPRALISLRSIPELSGIDIGDRIRIGAMTTITDLIQHPELGGILPVLIQAAKRLGGTQIRNVATIGGNLCNCSPCADTALPLLVLEAGVVLKGPESVREVPLSDFFVSPGESCLFPGEMLTDILLDKPAADTKAIFMKKGRVRMDLAIASLALLVEKKSDARRCRKVRIAAGSVAPVPLRLKEVEQLLENTERSATAADDVNKRCSLSEKISSQKNKIFTHSSTEISEEVLLKAQKMAEDIVSPISDIRSTEDYRRRIVGVYLKRALRELIQKTG